MNIRTLMYMLSVFLIVVLSALAFFIVLLIRSFESIQLRELKRQARGGSIHATRVYQARSQYGTELWLFLWLLVGLASSVVVLLLTSITWTWLAVLVSAALLVVSRLLLPKIKRPRVSLRLASRTAPVLSFTLRYLHPLLAYPSRILDKAMMADTWTTIHSKDELLELIRNNAENAHLSRFEATIASSALTFGDKVVNEVMVPIGVVRTVREDMLLTPVELAELHDSGFSRLPVQASGGQYVGTLFLKDIIEMRSSKHVKDVMRPGAYYVSEHAPLDQALRAFLKVHHHQFLVVNDFEEIVGVLSIEDIIEQIIGAQIVDEFDQYDDLRAVAQRRAKEIRSNREDSVVE